MFTIAQLFSRGAVDQVDAETGAPVGSPIGLVEAFDEEDEIFDVLREGFEPSVVVVTVLFR